MNSERHQRLREVFEAVCDLGPAERDAVLADTCGADEALRREVEALLARDGEEGDAFAEQNLGVGHEFVRLDECSGQRLAISPPETSRHGRFLPGTQVAGRYRIVSLLGRGGMGEVYQADDLKLEQVVALKFLPVELSANVSLLEYFRSEVRLSRQIAHPNVCRVYDIGEVDGAHFLSMEYVDGENLKHLLRRIGRLPGDKGIDIARQLCLGLAAAHDKGVLHRDLKPANVMIDGLGKVRITDFGLARLVTDDSTSGEWSGTPAYMAPEQLARGETTLRSDLYSLGLTLYELLTGEAARKTNSIEDLRRDVRKSTTKPPSSLVGDIDPAVERIVLACLRPDPDARPGSAYEVAAALPGGTALEMAIAAGETPSPAMVAAAGEGKGLSWPIGAACLLGVLLGLVGATWLSARAQQQLAFDATRLTQESRAREIVRNFGYRQEGGDSVWGLEWSEDYFQHYKSGETQRRGWLELLGGPPTAATFWYRQSSRDLVPLRGRGPYSAMFVTPDDPPLATPGEIRLRLDTEGRLLEFLAMPPVDDLPASRAGMVQAWRKQVLRAAGIDERVLAQRYTAHREGGPPPPVYADDRVVWEAESRELSVEAAAFQGRPVFFRVTPHRSLASPEGPRAFGIILSVVVLALCATSLWLARRNLRSGRADWSGAVRMFVFIQCASLLSWALQAHHVVGIGELVMVLETAARAALRGALICAAYIGVEPYVRRRWPQTLVDWSRLLRGHFHDRIIGRSLLVGAAGGVAAQCIGASSLLFGSERQPISLTADPALRVDVGPFPLTPLRGPLVALGQVVQESFVALVCALIVSLLSVFLLRLVLRRDWLAVAGSVVFFAVPSLVRGDAAAALAIALWVSTAMFVLFRFGVLTVAVGWVTWRILSWPVHFEFSTPHLDIGFVAYVAVAALACYGCFAAVSTRRSTL